MDLPFIGWWEELQIQLCCGSILPVIIVVITIVVLYLYKKKVKQ